MTEKKDVTRRGYLKYAGAGIVVVAGAAAGAYYATSPTPTQTSSQATTATTAATTMTQKGIRLIDADIDWKRFSGEEILVPMFPNEPACDRIREDTPEFEELTGIKVNYDMLAEPELRQKVALDLTTRTGNYDFIWNSPYEYALFKDSIEPLNSYMDDPQLCDKEWLDYDDFIPKFQSAHQDENTGDIYGILWCAESNMIYYRKDKYDEMD